MDRRLYEDVARFHYDGREGTAYGILGPMVNGGTQSKDDRKLGAKILDQRARKRQAQGVAPKARILSRTTCV